MWWREEFTDRIEKHMSRNALWMLGGLVVVTIFGVQFNQINHLKRELSAVKAELGTGSGVVVEADQDGTAIIPAATAAARPASDGNAGVTAGIQARLAALEHTVGEFTKAADLLMERGMIPPNEEKLAELQQRFFDPTLSDEERLKIFQLIRRGEGMSDAVLTQSLAMLQSSTNGNFKTALLQGFNGLTNEILKQPLLAMLQSETNQQFRGQVVLALSKFTQDPAIEAKLWEMALNEPDTGVRNRAVNAVTRGTPPTPERIAKMNQIVADPNASLDERLLSFRGLRIAKAHTPEMVNELATMAENTTDPVAKAKLLGSFNGLTEPSLMLPLVNGLQDPDPVVRQKAADSLGTYTDPRVQQWLEHVVKNDTDEAVRREAHRALEATRRLSRNEAPPGSPRLQLQ